jgi:hypothetical protein
MGIIYKLTNKLNNDFYIGKTEKCLSRRMKTHKKAWKAKTQTHLYRAFDKYGYENFSSEILEEVTDNSTLSNKEIDYISQLKPHYNMTKGGDGGNTTLIITEEWRSKLSERSKGKNNPMYGKIGTLNPNFGKKYGENPKISKALSNACVCDGISFESIGLAEKYFIDKNIPVSVRKRLDSKYHPTWFRIRPKRYYPSQAS